MLRNNIINNHNKERKILFYKLQTYTNQLLSKLLYNYSKQKQTLLMKHKEVMDYLHTQTNPLKTNLQKIYKIINANTKDFPYDIYITDKKLVIRNTTFKNDIGFNLSFAKNSFDEHFRHNVTGICTPLFEKSSKQFFSYTDEYMDKNKSGILQVSYVYKESKNKLLEIQNLIAHYPNIVDAKAYIVVDTGFINDIILKDFSAYTPGLQEILARIKDGLKINVKLSHKTLTIIHFERKGHSYTEMYIATKSAILDNTKILYSIVLDDASLKHKLFHLNVGMLIITFLGIIAILVSAKMRKEEIKLSEQDKFVRSSLHEIKTPLSIITLNNELREIEFGKDEYSQEIESAIKTLKNSYDDMNFMVTQGKIEYSLLLLDLGDIVDARVEYFQTIAKSNSKLISFVSFDNCKVFISEVELIRLIDNNLSNAIKYSSTFSNIEVKLQNNLLSFHNYGKPIKNIRKIFKKYFRENNIIGGHGLGLSIVSDIAKKYDIDVKLVSSKDNGTTFYYRFKCHNDDRYLKG